LRSASPDNKYLEPHEKEEIARRDALLHVNDADLIGRANQGLQALALEAAHRLAAAGIATETIKVYRAGRPPFWDKRKFVDSVLLEGSDPRARQLTAAWGAHWCLRHRSGVGVVDITTDGQARLCSGHSFTLDKGGALPSPRSLTVTTCIDPKDAWRIAPITAGHASGDFYRGLLAADLNGRAYYYFAQDGHHEAPVVYVDDAIAAATVARLRV